jgi:Na+/phosphate symporter
VAVVALPYEENFDVILKRIFFMVENMLNDIIETLKANKYENLKEIASVETSINSFVDFCLRILNKKGYKDYRRTPYIYQILNGLEQIGDALRDFCIASPKKNNNPLSILKDFQDYLLMIRNLFYKYDMKAIGKIKEKRIKLLEDLRLASESTYLAIYVAVSVLHQMEIALDPINN